jgi:hypothetical protein
MAFNIFVKCGKLEKCVCVCDFNGRELKDLNILCCVSILLASVEGRSVGDCTSLLF